METRVYDFFDGTFLPGKSRGDASSRFSRVFLEIFSSRTAIRKGHDLRMEDNSWEIRGEDTSNVLDVYELEEGESVTLAKRFPEKKLRAEIKITMVEDKGYRLYKEKQGGSASVYEAYCTVKESASGKILGKHQVQAESRRILACISYWKTILSDIAMNRARNRINDGVLEEAWESFTIDR